MRPSDTRATCANISFQLFDWLPTSELLKNDLYSQWEEGDIEIAPAEALRLAQEQIEPAHPNVSREGVERAPILVTMRFLTG